MRIHLLHLLGGARQARGLAVVIDVFRAFSTALYLHQAGPASLRAADDLDLARGVRRREPDVLLAGESGGIRPEDFDLGNSPCEVLEAARAGNLAGRDVVLATSAGARGLVAATAAAEEVVAASFVNAGAVARYVRRAAPGEVSLIAMGWAGRERAPEDELCAMYLKNELEGFPNAFAAIAKHLRTAPAARKFFDPQAGHAPEEDFNLCLSLDRFDVVLRAEPARSALSGGREGLVALRPVRVPPGDAADDGEQEAGA